MVDELDNSNNNALGFQAVVEGAEAVVPLVVKGGAKNLIAPLQAIGTAATEGYGYLDAVSTHAQKFGKEDLSRIGDGFAAPGDYRPELESESKLASNAWIGVGKGIVLACVGIPFMAMGPWGIIPSIIACIAANWVYDKAVGRWQAQDPLRIAEAMRDQRDDIKDVAPEMVFALMVSSLPPEDKLRQELESRLKGATGSHKFHKVLSRPEAVPAVTLLMQDPSVVARLCETYGVLPEKNFIQHVTRLYNQGEVHTRGIMYANSQDVALAIMDEQMLAANTRPLSPQMNLPSMTGIKSPAEQIPLARRT